MENIFKNFLKQHQKSNLKKKAEETGGLARNKAANKITKNSPRNNS